MARFKLSLASILTLVGMTGSAFAQEVVRGPYLQIGTPTSIVVKWRTEDPTDSAVRYGTEFGNQNSIVEGTNQTTEHAIKLTGLAPDTKYYYSIGTTNDVLAGGDAEHFFLTSPEAGTNKPTRVWILGDSGTKNDNARAVRDAYYEFTKDQHTDLWLMLGDNAYSGGGDGSYQKAVFEDMYEQMLRKSVLWPTLGNHDDNSFSTPGPYPYYDIFDMPTSGEAGGIASGSEAYYSFDYGNIHFISLNSATDDLRSSSSAMWIWLEEDLAANVRDWTIAFWHHPPYSKGSHDSDSEGELVTMRERALPLLEGNGIDLVLSGHSHSYERSFLLDSHYGKSNTLTDEMKLDGGDGRTDGDGAYDKATLGPAAHEGAVFIVAGSSGKVSGADLDHPVMISSLELLGSVVLDISGSTLEAKFIDDQGNIGDYFTIRKDGYALKAAFSASPLNGEAPLATTFTNESGGTFETYGWDFGDGGTSTQENPTHTYATPGIYSVSLTVTSTEGSDTETKPDLVVVSAPGSSVTASFQDGVAGYSGARDTELKGGSKNANFGSSDKIKVDGSPDVSSLFFWDLSAISAGSIIEAVSITVEVTNGTDDTYNLYAMTRPWVEDTATWNQFADGENWEVAGAEGSLDRGSASVANVTASDLGSTVIALNASGVAIVQTWVNDPGANNGFILSNYSSASNKLEFYSRETENPANRPKLSVTYTPLQAPTANFSASPTSGTAPLEVIFSNVSTGQNSTYEWDLGDGTTSSLPNPVHVYDLAGAYSVSLTVTGPGGSATEVKTDYIFVSAPAQTITISFQDGANGYSGTRDADIRSNNRNRNFGEATKLRLDGNPDLSALLYWDISSVPPGSAIQSVTITQNVVNAATSQYSFYEVKRPWIENEATWGEYATGQAWELEGANGPGDRGAIALGFLTAATTGIKATTLNSVGVALVQAWVDDPGSNYGLLLLNYTDTADRLEFSSREVGAVSKRPRLSITYSASSAPTAQFTSVKFQQGLNGFDGARDAELRSGSANTNYESATKLRLDGSPDISAIFFWDITSVPVGSVLESGALTFDVVNTSIQPYHLYALRRPWAEDEVTWNLASADQVWSIEGANGTDDRASTVLGSLITTTAGLNALQLNAAGIATVQSWINDPSSNRGFVLLNYEEATDRLEIHSSETGTVENRPSLTLSYTRPEAPVAEFEASLKSGDAPLEISFANAATGAVENYLWEFGDGESSTEANPTHVYSSPGLYSVSLSVEGVAGADSKTRSDYIFVTSPGPITVSFQDGANGYNGTRDTGLRSSLPNTNLGNASKVKLDGSPGMSGLLRWNLSAIPSGSTIQSVEITLNIENPSNDSYAIYRAKRPWVENEANWTEFSVGRSWGLEGADGTADRGRSELGRLVQTSTGPVTISLNNDGVALVQSWVDNASTNEGLVLQNYTNAHDRMEFSSRENAEVVNRPKITVTYFFPGSVAKANPGDHSSFPQRRSSGPPLGFELQGNYPNPFNPSTVIAYSLREATKVELIVFDLLGRQVAALVNESQSAGKHKVLFDAGGMATGSYFVRLRAGGLETTRRMLFAK